MNAWQGRYQIENGGLFSIITEDGKLVIMPEDQQAFDMLFPASVSKQALESMQENVENYINSGNDQILENWKAETTFELGEYKKLQILGSAAGQTVEPATYVSFEFEKGVRYGWFIVNKSGSLLGALLDVPLPAISLWLQSPTECVTFSIRQSYSVERIRLEEVSQGSNLVITTSEGVTLLAERMTQ